MPYVYIQVGRGALNTMIFKYNIHAIIMDYHFLIYIFGFRIHWKVHISSIYKRNMQKTALNTYFYCRFTNLKVCFDSRLECTFSDNNKLLNL